MLAPILSGGSAICCPYFDATLFWDIIDDIPIQPTWYQASPSVHHVILKRGLSRVRPLPPQSRSTKIRLVCVTEGDAVPSLERWLRDTFQCLVLPDRDAERCVSLRPGGCQFQSLAHVVVSKPQPNE